MHVADKTPMTPATRKVADKLARAAAGALRTCKELESFPQGETADEPIDAFCAAMERLERTLVAYLRTA